MNLKIFTDKNFELFYEQNYSYWMEDEDSNMAIMRAVKSGKAGNLYFSVLDDNEKTALTACLTPNDQILISQASIGSLEVLTSYLKSESLEVPGIFAPHPASTHFADSFSSKTGRKFKIVKSMWHYSLNKLAEIRLTEGSLHIAKPEDKETLIEFREAAQKEENTQRPSNSREDIEEGFENKAIYTWKDKNGLIVCMSFLILDRSPSTGYISNIYTPPIERKKGYATAITHSLSKLVQDKDLVPRLSVDIENLAAIGVYERIGFKRICQMNNIRQERSN